MATMSLEGAPLLEVEAQQGGAAAPTPHNRRAHGAAALLTTAGLVAVAFVSMHAASARSAEALLDASGDDGMVRLHNLSSITLGLCAELDDDTLYPVQYECTQHDPEQCAKSCGNGTGCNDICGTTCDYKSAGVDDLPDYAANMSYAFACAWEAIAALDETCESHFTPSFPVAKDSSPDMEKGELSVAMPEVGKTTSWSKQDNCALHAFCSTCVETDGTHNVYCDAVSSFFEATNDPVDSAFYALNKMSYWCQTDVIESIQDGSFNSKCTDDKSADSDRQCR